MKGMYAMELRMENITKRFQDKTAVQDVSLTLTPGVWGLLGVLTLLPHVRQTFT